MIACEQIDNYLFFLPQGALKIL